jgi:hypothetical protein
MQIHPENSYALRGKKRIGRHEAQGREQVNKLKKTLCVTACLVEARVRSRRLLMLVVALVT